LRRSATHGNAADPNKKHGAPLSVANSGQIPKVINIVYPEVIKSIFDRIINITVLSIFVFYLVYSKTR
jgi:hypothetical protein